MIEQQEIPPPMARVAQCDLLKQLQVYVDLRMVTEQPKQRSYPSLRSNRSFVSSSHSLAALPPTSPPNSASIKKQPAKLKPLIPAEVAAAAEPFIGREWLLREIDKTFDAGCKLVLVAGQAGSGKTRLVQHLYHTREAPVAVYFADERTSQDLAHFLHTLVWCLCKHFDNKFRDVLMANQRQLWSQLLNKDMCRLEPETILRRCVLEPLQQCDDKLVYMAIDAIDTPGAVGSFLLKHVHLFPSWFRFLATSRRSSVTTVECKSHVISLEHQQHSFSSHLNQKDLVDYINYRIGRSADLQKNILYYNTSQTNVSTPHGFNTLQQKEQLMQCSNYSSSSSASSYSTLSAAATTSKLDSSFQHKFVQHLIACGGHLFAKLILDLIERGQLVVKSGNFRVLPRSLADLFKLYCNLRFKTLSQDRLAAYVFSLCAHALAPLTLAQLYESLMAIDTTSNKLTWLEFLDVLAAFDGVFLAPYRYIGQDEEDKVFLRFVHASFREWWCTQSKFGCDAKWSHSMLALQLYRSTSAGGDESGDDQVYLNLIHHLINANDDADSTAVDYSNTSQSMSRFDSLCHVIALNFSHKSPEAACAFYTRLLLSSAYLQTQPADLSTFRVLVHLGADYQSKWCMTAAACCSSTPTSRYGNKQQQEATTIPFICMLARLGHAALVRALCDEFQATDHLAAAVDDHGSNALCYAIVEHEWEVARVLLDKSKDPARDLALQDSSGHCAAVYFALQKTGSQPLFVQMLTTLRRHDYRQLLVRLLVLCAQHANMMCLQAFVDLFGPSFLAEATPSGDSALGVACSAGHKQVCELLVEHGGDGVEKMLSHVNGKSWTPLLCAVKAGEWEIVELLLAKAGPAAIVHQVDKHGRNALVLAASDGHLAILDILLEQMRDDVEAEDKDGLTALSWACLKGHYNAAQTLLAHQADVNHADLSGRTPLDLATFFGDVRLIQLLLDKGAQIEHVDKIGMRPLDRAIGCRNVPIVSLFLKRGAKLGPATWAMAAGKPEIIITLLNKLVEDGNTLYRKGCFLEALQRYSYTLKKFPKDPTELTLQPENITAIIEMKFNLFLNLARCHRKLQEFQCSVDLCTLAIDVKQDSYEAFYSRARAKRDLKQYESALDDLKRAFELCPTNCDIKKLMNKINDDMMNKSSSSSSGVNTNTNPRVKNSKSSQSTKLNTKQHRHHHHHHQKNGSTSNSKELVSLESSSSTSILYSSK